MREESISVVVVVVPLTFEIGALICGLRCLSLPLAHKQFHCILCVHFDDDVGADVGADADVVVRLLIISRRIHIHSIHFV